VIAQNFHAEFVENLYRLILIYEPQVLMELKSQVTELKSQVTDVQIKQEKMDANLKLLLNNNSTQSEKKNDKGRDRTRFKERLKKASLTASKQTLRQGAGWLASMFGITHGDRRAGIERNRLMICLIVCDILRFVFHYYHGRHHQSPFLLTGFAALSTRYRPSCKVCHSSSHPRLAPSDA
jgi:hypothetical protein